MKSLSATVASGTAGSPAARWGQLVGGVLCMVMIANLQYGWTLFVNPIDQKYHWGTAAIQVAFSVFIATETWLVPVEGWFVDRFGPRVVVAFGGIFVACAWALNSVASSLWELYVAAALSGIGAGAVYGTCVGNALKWFPDLRGLAAGLTAAGFGAGTAATVIPIREMILGYGYETLSFGSGWGRGSSFCCCRGSCARRSRVKRPKPAAQADAFAARLRAARNAAIAGILAALPHVRHGRGVGPDGDRADRADRQGFRPRRSEVNVFFVTATTLSAALVIDNILQWPGAAVLRLGVRHHRPREHHGDRVHARRAAYWGLGAFGHTPYMFILLAGFIFFTWGEIFSLFPAIATDTYGVKYATANAGLLYTAKGAAVWVVPVASVIKNYTGSWHWVFVIAAIMNLTVAVLALFVLKPMRRRITKG